MGFVADKASATIVLIEAGDRIDPRLASHVIQRSDSDEESGRDVGWLTLSTQTWEPDSLSLSLL